jgi:secretion/DNA translocation related TadE-like protein
MTRGASDVGSGTVLVLAVIAVVVTAAGVLAVLVRGQVAALSVRAAADLAALAAARAVALPEGIVLAPGVAPDRDAACARAEEVARRNGATVTSCTARRDAVVTVSVRGGEPWSASATARAGPPSARAGP